MNYEYYINLDERGCFYADVREEETEETIFEIFDYQIFEDGFMDHKEDIDGLRDYLRDIGIMTGEDSLSFNR